MCDACGRIEAFYFWEGRSDMKEKIIGVMGAMPEDIRLLYDRMTDRGEETAAGVTF